MEVKHNDTDNNDVVFKLGQHYQSLGDYDNMKKCYLMGIDKGNVDSMRLMGCYYQMIDNKEKMEKYYLMAIEQGDIYSMFNMGCYYKQLNDIENMEKYYIMAINKGNCGSMYELAYYYDDHEIKPEEMINYYLMAIEKGHILSMFNLAMHYHEVDDVINMEKYYLMAIEKGDGDAMNNLAVYYGEIHEYDMAKIYLKMGKKINHYDCIINLSNLYNVQHNDEKKLKCYLKALELKNDDPNLMLRLGYYYKNINEQEMIKYYTMGINLLDESCLNNLIHYYRNNDKYIEILKLYIDVYKKDIINRYEVIDLFNAIATMNNIDDVEFLHLISSFQFEPEDKLCIALKLLINTLKQKIDLLDLHFKYSPDGLGFDEAKADFLSQCVS